jgi:fibronectin type 3 domain-containing protein
MPSKIRKVFSALLLLFAILFAGNAKAIINSTATDGTQINKVIHSFVSGGSCTYVSYNHYELHYRKLPTASTWTLYFSRYVPGGYYYLYAEDTGGTPGQSYDYYMEVASPSLYLWCNGYTDRGWANNPPTALSASMPGSTIGGGTVCTTISVSDPNQYQPNTSVPEVLTYSLVSQPAVGSAYVSGNQVCYTPPASGPTQSYSFTIRVTDKAGSVLNGTASGTVTNPTPPPSQISNLSATDGTITNAINLSWSPSTSTTSYDIYRSIASGTLGALIANTTTNSYSDTQYTATLYYYTVIPKNINGPGPWSNQNVGHANLAPTASSANISTVVGGARQCVTPSVTDANTSQGDTFTFSIITQPTVGTASIVSNKVCYTPISSGTGGSYSFTYRVTDMAGATFVASATVSVLGQPQNVTATQGTLYGKSTVSWTAVASATSYDIYRSTSAGTKGSIISAGFTGTAYDDTTVSGSTHYFYTVVAKNALFTSPDSAQTEGWGKVPTNITDLTATKGILQNKVGLSWSKNPDATGYQIWRATTSGGVATQIGTVGAMAVGYYEDTTTVGMTRYYYTVKAVVGTTVSAPSNEAMGYAIVPVSQVTGVTATQGTLYGKSTVSWKADSAAASYDIYRSTTSGTKGTLFVTVGTNTYDDTSVSGSTHYFYTVVAKNLISTAPDSAQAEGWGKAPTTITDLTATKGTLQSKVGLTWTKNVDATGYEIWRATSSDGTATLITTTGVLATGYYEDTTTVGMTQYFYTVKTVVGTVKSLPSNEAMGIAVIPVSKITGVTATQGTLYGKSTITWNADSAASTYDIYRSASAGTKGSLIGSSTSPTYDDTTVSGITHYFYTVVGKNILGVSPDSDQAEGWGKVPGVVSDLVATQGTVTDLIKLDWSAVADATSYEIWRSATSTGATTKLGTVTAPSITYADNSVSGVSVYYYTVRATVGALVGADSNQVSGYANRAPTVTSLILTSPTSTTASSAQVPAVTDPNKEAGQDDNFTFAILTQPSKGLVSISGGDKFTYTPPSDGATSGHFTFTYSVSDKVGAMLNGTGDIYIYCKNYINGVSLASSNLEQTPINVIVDYSVPQCATGVTTNLDIKDGNGTQVFLIDNLFLPGIGNNLTKTFTINPLPVSVGGPYIFNLNMVNDVITYADGDSWQQSFSVDPVALPILTITPSLNITVGQDTQVKASLSNPPAANCPFTTDLAAALADPSLCYVKFTSIPPGMTENNSGSLPYLTGIITDGGSFPVTAEIQKSNGTQMLKMGVVTQTIEVACVPAVIASLNVPSVLSYEDITFDTTYKGYGCNAPMTSSLVIKKGTSVVDTKDLGSLVPGLDLPISVTTNGLPGGYYTAELSITGNSGTKVQAKSFLVKEPPMPNLMVSPTSVFQSEGRVDASLQPSADTACPLTVIQAEAEANQRKCYVVMTTTLSDMAPGIDTNGLPTLSGHPGTPGDFEVKVIISRWIKGTRYDSEPLVETVHVDPLIQPTFKFTGDTNIYVGVEKLSLVFTQDSGTTCTLYSDVSAAQAEAAKSKRTCIAEFQDDFGLTKTLAFNQYKVTGTIGTIGTQTISYAVSRVFADGLKSAVVSGEQLITVNDIPPPTIKLKGGYPISDGKYYVPLNQPITRATISAGVPTNAKIKLTVTDTQQDFVRNDIVSDSSYWIYTPNLGLLEQRPVTLRIAWQDYPSVYTEKVITAVGGAESNMKLTLDAPKVTPDTENITVRVNVGKYINNVMSYSAATMGQWRAQIVAQTNTQSVKVPVTDMLDLTDGVAEFQINPAGNLFMKLTAIAELVTNVNGLNTTLSSPTRYIEVVKGSPIEGQITSKSLDGPAPKTFTLNLVLTQDNRVALKEIAWEESEDGGLTWTAIEKSNTTRRIVSMQSPGKRQVRAKMINKNTLLESYTTPVEVWAYSKLESAITGPRHVSPGYTALLTTELFRDGQLTNDTVNEWIIEAPSGKTTADGSSVAITEELEGKVNITLRSRPSDTRADDKNAWSVARHYLVVKTPDAPAVMLKGPRDVEVGKNYQYEGVVKPSWGAMESVHAIKSEWQLPNGSTVPGDTLSWSPSQSDLANRKPLLFRAWVDGFKDTTTKEATLNYVPWEYVWPNFSIALKQQTIQAPSDINLIVTHDRPDMGRRFEGLIYEWSFPKNVDGRQNDAFPNRATGQVIFAGEYDVTVTIRDTRGHQTLLTQHVIAEPAAPYAPTIKIGKSNIYERAPMTVTVRPTIYGGHPLDSVVNQIWKIDGTTIDEYTNRSYMVSTITAPGDHTISYTLNSKMGETATVTEQLQLVPNQPPSCQLTAIPNAYVVYAEAKCTDADGKIVGYAWQVNDQPIGATSYRISFGKTGTPQSANVTITALDDAKVESTPVSIVVNY